MGWGTGNLDGGSGGGLNFKVVGNPRPSNPKENTIWVNTDNKITGYYFQAKQPVEMAEGEVWISTGTYSQAAFNALKKGTVMVYPISAKQYVSGACVDVTAQSYQGGAWVDWWNGELYDTGNEFVAVTGGWIGTPKGYDASNRLESEPDIIRGETSLTMNVSAGGGSIVHTKNKIDLTEYSSLVFDGTVTGAGLDSLCNFRVWSEIGAYSKDNAVATKTFKQDVDGIVAIDISGLSGTYYVGFAFWTNLATVVMRSLRLE